MLVPRKAEWSYLFMKIFQLKLCYYFPQGIPLKIIAITIIIGFCVFNLSAQEESNIKLKIETGLLMTSENSERLGLFFRVEPKLKIFKNTFLGLRVGASINEQIMEGNDLSQFNFYDNVNDSPIQFINPSNGLFSVVPTVDYYFMDKKYRPYLGVGMGYYFLTNYTDVSRRGAADPFEDLLELSVQNQAGFLIRGGLNFGRLVAGLEFNYLPLADIEIPNGQIIGRVDNRYIGLSFGYVIGVGKKLK